MPGPDESLVRFRRVVAAALAELEERRQEVNDLNVFPVADGDTGDNMALTLKAVLDELDELEGKPIDQIPRDEIVSAVARAALLGARGNSGVILSQIVRGAAEELASRPGELVDPILVSAAFARAADAAYASVRDPAEGTMLSAVRAMASRVAHDLAHMDMRRLGPDATPQEQDELLAEVLENALEAAKEAVERGPEQLAILRESGVVDAGAYGLTVIIAGCLAALRGDAGPELEHHYAPAALHRPEHESSSFRYCTNFAVTGESLDAGHFTPLLEELGDSVLVVGDDRTLRVHVHTDEPGQGRRAVRARGRGVALRRGRHARAGGRAQRAPGRRRADRDGLRRGGRGERGGGEAALRGAWSAGGGRWRDDEPLDLRAAGRHPRRARCRGGGAAQQPQRDPGRRARGRAVGEARPGGAHDRAAGGAGGAARLRPRARLRGEREAGGRQRAGAARGRRGPGGPRRRARALRRRRRGGLRRRRAGGLGRPGGARSPPRSRGWPTAPSCSPASPARRRRSSARPWRRARRTGWRWSSTRAASPPGGGCSAPSEALRLDGTAARRRPGPLLSRARACWRSRSPVPRRWPSSGSRPGAT